MSRLLFRLRDVPQDEADEVRGLLERHEIDYFETSAGNWGIAIPALWLKEDSRYAEARALLDEYESERRSRVRQEYELLKQRGEAPTIWGRFREGPLRFVSYLVLVGLVLYLSLTYFVSFILGT